MPPPIFDESPEHLCVSFSSSSPVSSHERVNEPKARGLPDDLYVTVVEVADIAPVKVGGRSLAGKRISVPVERKPGLNTGVPEVTQAALFKTIAQLNRCIGSAIPAREARLIFGSTIWREKEPRSLRSPILQIVLWLCKRLVRKQPAKRLVVPARCGHLTSQRAGSHSSRVAQPIRQPFAPQVLPQLVKLLDSS